MKKISILCLTVLITTACGLDAGSLKESGNNFVKLLKDGNYQTAYEQTSEQFREIQTQDQLERLSKYFYIDRFEKVSWNRFKITNKGGELEGNFDTTDGKKVGIMIEFKKEEDLFKPMYLKLEKLETHPAPDDTKVKALLQNTMLVLISDLEKGDFSDFYNQEFTELRKITENITPDTFKESFTELLEKPEEINFIKNTKPTITKKDISANGLTMDIIGYYSKNGQKVDFVTGFIYEESDWKVTNIQINPN